MKTYSLCLVLLFAAIAKAAVPKRPDNSVNEVHHDFQEDIHLMENETTSSEAIFLRDYEYEIEKEKLLGNYDDPDDDYFEDYDKDEDWASGDDYDDEDEELLDDYEAEDDITFNDDEDEELLDDYKEEDDITFDDEDEELLDDYEKDDDITFDDEDEELLDEYEEDDDITFEDYVDEILYKLQEDYKEIDDYNFSKEIEDVVFQPPLVQIQDHGMPDKEDDTLTCEKLSPSSRNLLVSNVLFASGLASFSLFTLAFIIYFCNRQRKDSTSAKKAQLPFVIQHGSSSSPLHSSIIKPGKYQPVATQENHSIENYSSILKQQTQLEEKLLP